MTSTARTSACDAMTGTEPTLAQSHPVAPARVGVVQRGFSLSAVQVYRVWIMFTGGLPEGVVSQNVSYSTQNPLIWGDFALFL